MSEKISQLDYTGASLAVVKLIPIYFVLPVFNQLMYPVSGGRIFMALFIKNHSVLYF